MNKQSETGKVIATQTWGGGGHKGDNDTGN